MIVFEDLGVQRMTRRARPKQDESGRWVRNGAAAKSGLDAPILASSWGRIKQCGTNKALRAGKLCLTVPAHHTSQDCVACGHQDNADVCLEGHCDARSQPGQLGPLQGQRLQDFKLMMRMRPRLGLERPEVTPGESRVSRGTGNGATPLTQNQEPPATRLCVSGGRVHRNCRGC